MRRLACAFLVAALAAVWAGCATDADPIETSHSDANSSGLVLVSLSVPNMT